MRFFRSEEALRQWQAASSNTGGEALNLMQLWELSKRWYHNRLSRSYHGRTLAEIEGIFSAMNFTSDFWYVSRT